MPLVSSNQLSYPDPKHQQVPYNKAEAVSEILGEKIILYLRRNSYV